MPLNYVYILQSQKNGTFYKGYTTDYLKRLHEHNLGLSKYTSSKDTLGFDLCQSPLKQIICINQGEKTQTL